MRQFIIGCTAGGIFYILNYIHHKSSKKELREHFSKKD